MMKQANEREVLRVHGNYHLSRVQKMYQIGICDDDPMFIKYIERLFDEEGLEAEFHEYLSGEELIRNMKERDGFDLLVLDVMMPGMDGNETAKEFRTQFSDTLLVFCSGICKPTVESFETTPYRYWLKEYTEEKMKEEIQDVLRKMEKDKKVSPFVTAKKGSRILKLTADQIYYIAIAKKGTKIYCEGENEIYTSSKKLAEFYEQLKEFGFAYAHNSYIVNLKHVAVVSLKEMELKNGKKLTISRARAKEFRKAFAEDVAQKYER